jgi:hypothetical protein
VTSSSSAGHRAGTICHLPRCVRRAAQSANSDARHTILRRSS